MLYEYLVRTIGTSSLDNLEHTGQKLQVALNNGEADAYGEMGWELWQVNVLNDASGNNGLIFIYRRSKQPVA